MKSRYHLAWNETSFFSKLAYLLRSEKEAAEKLQSDDEKVKGDTYTSLSSVYYSIAGTAGKQYFALYEPWWLFWASPLRFLWYFITWVPLGLYCKKKAIRVSDKGFLLLGFDRMSASQCDVRQSNLRREGRLLEAYECIQEGLQKEFKYPATPALLRIGLADIALRTGDKEESFVCLERALLTAGSIETSDPNQAARIYRHGAKLAEQIGGPGAGDWMRVRAREIAIRSGAKDQLFKQRR